MQGAGELNKRVTLQQDTPARDATGQPIESWGDVGETWAAIDPLRGREYFAAQQFAAETTHRVKIRHRAGVSPKMRVKFGSRYFRIEAVLNVKEANEMLHLMCVEVLA